MAATRQVTIKPTDGGQYLSDFSGNNVGEANYVEKTNWRRVDDCEQLREGWDLLPGAEWSAPRAIAEAVLPSGTREIVVCTALNVYVYNTSGWVSVFGASLASYDWQLVDLNGRLFINNGIDLPFWYQAGGSTVTPCYEMREIGIARVGCMTVYNGFLVCADITEVRAEEMGDLMTGVSPYGQVDPALCNRVRYKVAWSEYGDGRSWAPIATGTVSAAGAEITLDWVPSNLVVGAKVAVTGAGPNGSILGGQVGFDDGVPITDVDGLTITLATSTDAGLTYPLSVTVMEYADLSTLSKSAEVQDDSSAIVRLKTLAGGATLILYRDTSIFVGRYTANVDQPFNFREIYRGPNVPVHPRTIVEVTGVHYYAGKDRFWIFDGAGAPQEAVELNRCHRAWFDIASLQNPQYCCGAVNPVTQEVWMSNLDSVLAYDTRSRTVSSIDHTFYSFGWVYLGGDANSLRFLMGHNSGVSIYGRDSNGWSTYLRDGASFTATLKFGLVSLGDEYADKTITRYIPMLSDASVSTPLALTLASTRDPNLAVTTRLSVSIDDPAGHNLVSVLYRDTYFQDTLSVTQTTDVSMASPPRVRFMGRMFEVAPTKSKAFTRTTHT